MGGMAKARRSRGAAMSGDWRSVPASATADLGMPPGVSVDDAARPHAAGDQVHHL